MVAEQPQESFGERVLSTGYKVSGWNLRLKAIGSFITGTILLILGIVLAIVLKSWGALILSAVGIFAFLGGWLYWRRAKSLTKGRYY
ncbi:MAG: hypothetical protein Q7S74_00490 [Nanoarchaeota archaeon]|nr:hypothetical protein [Nanoarchaeota archaeon]